ncbi:hypothetical protein V1264_015850 [Littorina saxatilis]|uniref:Uncharacterized protein n=1 Tax=Littorina saxatilis TaxID=31220 RepID=A0AAN9GGG8_9CAEN
MDPVAFHEHLTRIEGRITKQQTHWRKPLAPGLKLAITLRYLATGDFAVWLLGCPQHYLPPGDISLSRHNWRVCN